VFHDNVKGRFSRDAFPVLFLNYAQVSGPLPQIGKQADGIFDRSLKPA
jgi:hypothetical protein